MRLFVLFGTKGRPENHPREIHLAKAEMLGKLRVSQIMKIAEQDAAGATGNKLFNHMILFIPFAAGASA